VARLSEELRRNVAFEMELICNFCKDRFGAVIAVTF
jgi:hypothetical protein